MTSWNVSNITILVPEIFHFINRIYCCRCGEDGLVKEMFHFLGNVFSYLLTRLPATIYMRRARPSTIHSVLQNMKKAQFSKGNQCFFWKNFKWRVLQGTLGQIKIYFHKSLWKPVQVLQGRIGVFLNPNDVICHMRSPFKYPSKNEDFFPSLHFYFSIF